MFTLLSKKINTVVYTLLFFVVVMIPTVSFAQNATAPGTATYTFLAPLDNNQTFNAAQDNALSIYLNMIIKILIAIAAVLAMIMIVRGGIEYMTSDVVSSKAEGKSHITNAIIGLLLALSAYLLLYTINPDLLKTIDTGNNSTSLPVPTPPKTSATPVAFPNGPVADPIGNCNRSGTITRQTKTNCNVFPPGVWTP